LTVKLKDNADGSYTELFTGEVYELARSKPVKLDAWGYLVLTK
jgi:hypothetical protein